MTKIKQHSQSKIRSLNQLAHIKGYMVSVLKVIVVCKPRIRELFYELKNYFLS